MFILFDKNSSIWMSTKKGIINGALFLLDNTPQIYTIYFVKRCFICYSYGSITYNVPAG